MQSKVVRYSSRKGGFTLVEILIVVIILGILAAIVIPQFTNASQDARKSSVSSLLQTIRSQIELYKIQHSDGLPDLQNGASKNLGTPNTGAWADLIDVSTVGSSTSKLGPYLQAAPVNPLNGESGVTDIDVSGVAPTTAAAGSGWVFDYGTAGAGSGKIWATNQTDTKVYDESGLTVPQVQ
jgi:general secretion pathway protein G